ncbi:MAG TPA: hypothetical protein VJ482_01000 [Acidimicrobiia bacterium]|nr:hypothetical protein [Acidimicrobiia bacterium]
MTVLARSEVDLITVETGLAFMPNPQLCLLLVAPFGYFASGW